MMIFGIPIEGWSLADTLARLSADDPRPRWLVTANPEILLHARRDPSYAVTLRQADARLVDGFGLWLMLKLFGQNVTRTTGVDLAEALIRKAVEKSWRVGLIGGSANVAERAAETLKKKFPGLSVSAEQGGQIGADGQDIVRSAHDLSANAEARYRLTLFAPNILLVAFGHPKQERWIAAHLGELPSVQVVIGVGGTLDYWAGIVPRAPTVIRQIGLEWLWRFMIEPWRIKRIWHAVVEFPLLFILDKQGRT